MQAHCMPAHQVGGEPYFAQGYPDHVCPKCKKPLTFLASIADETLGDAGFTDNDGVQVVFMICKRDRLIASFQQCD